MSSIDEKKADNDAIEMMNITAVALADNGTASASSTLPTTAAKATAETAQATATADHIHTINNGMALASSPSPTTTAELTNENALVITTGDEICVSISIDASSVNSPTQDCITTWQLNEHEDMMLFARINTILRAAALFTASSPQANGPLAQVVNHTPVQAVNSCVQDVNLPAQITTPPVQVNLPAPGIIASTNTPLHAPGDTIETTLVDTGIDLERQGHRHIFKRHYNPPCHGKEHGSHILEAHSAHLFWNHAFLFAMPAADTEADAVRAWLTNAFELSDDLDMAQLPSIIINGLGLRNMCENSMKDLLTRWGISEAGITFIWKCVEAARRNADLQAQDAYLTRKNKKKFIKHVRLFMAGLLFCFLICEPMLAIWLYFHYRNHDPAYGAVAAFIWIAFFIPLVYCVFRDYHYNMSLWARFREYWALA